MRVNRKRKRERKNDVNGFIWTFPNNEQFVGDYDITQLVYAIEFPIIARLVFISSSCYLLERHHLALGLFNANLNGNTQEIFEIPLAWNSQKKQMKQRNWK